MIKNMGGTKYSKYFFWPIISPNTNIDNTIISTKAKAMVNIIAKPFNFQ